MDFKQRTLNLLTRFHILKIQNPNPNPNPDPSPQPQRQHQLQQEGNDADDDVGGGRPVQTASSSTSMSRGDDVSGDGELQIASLSQGRTSCDCDGDVDRDGELETASSCEEMADGDAEDDGDWVEVTGEEATTGSSGGKGEEMKFSEEKRRMEEPPSDDCCPICFGTFVVPCRGPCGHWYCGGCVLQYWNYTAALQPCNCPMCSRKITQLTPEASLYQQREAEVVEVLKNVRKYNRLFVGGVYGLVLKVFELPLYIKRMFSEMMNPDRPAAHMNKLRLFAMLLGVLYSFSPFDFLWIGRQNVVDIFDYSAIALSLILYVVGIYMRRQRFRHVQELAGIQH